MNNKDALKALKDGLIDGGCKFVSNYPGFFSHDLFHILGGKIASLNEKCAYESAYGASLSGVRSVVTMKNAGLNIASDPFLNSIISGVNAGLVLVVTDDTEMTGSQTRQDSRNYFDFFGGLWFEPNSIQNAYDIGYQSFVLSEKLDIPIVIRLTNQFFSNTGKYIRCRPLRVKHNLPSKKDSWKYIIHPTNWRKQEKTLKEKQKKIEKYIKSIYKDRTKYHLTKKTKIIIIGNCQKEYKLIANQFEGIDLEDMMKIFTYPLPINEIKEFIGNSERVVILEQGSNFAEKSIKQGLVGYTKFVHNDGIRPALDNTYIIYNGLKKIFSCLKSIRPDYVVGDVGLYTRDISRVIRSCLSYGSSIAISMGMSLASKMYPFCIIGDGAFSHSGINSLREVVIKKAPMCIIVIDNGGMQSVSGEKICDDIYSINNIERIIVNYSPAKPKEIEKIFKTAKNKKKLVLVYIKIHEKISK